MTEEPPSFKPAIHDCSTVYAAIGVVTVRCRWAYNLDAFDTFLEYRYQPLVLYAKKHLLLVDVDQFGNAR